MLYANKLGLQLINKLVNITTYGCLLLKNACYINTCLFCMSQEKVKWGLLWSATEIKSCRFFVQLNVLQHIRLV